jgi:hypothetical protein
VFEGEDENVDKWSTVNIGPSAAIVKKFSQTRTFYGSLSKFHHSILMGLLIILKSVGLTSSHEPCLNSKPSLQSYYLQPTRAFCSFPGLKTDLKFGMHLISQQWSRHNRCGPCQYDPMIIFIKALYWKIRYQWQRANTSNKEKQSTTSDLSQYTDEFIEKRNAVVKSIGYFIRR